MKLRQDFSKGKIALYSISIFICLIMLGNFIATSFGTFDDDMSSIFYKAMDIPFFRGWASYTISDGYITIVSYVAPAILMIVECIWMFVKKYQPNWWISQHISLYKYLLVLVTLLFEFMIIYMWWYWTYSDHGFGVGYSSEFIVGPEYLIPEYVVSLVIANVVYFSLVWWLHFKLAKRPDFLELKIWRPMATSLMYMAFGYIVVQYTKAGIDRPYWYNVHWTDGLLNDDGTISNIANGKTVGGYEVKGILERYRELYHSQYEYFMSHPDGYGWHDKDWNLVAWDEGLRNWKWYMNGHPYSSNMWGGAFPSGHMIATAVVALSPTYIFIVKSNSKKYNITKYCFFALSWIYLLDMAFALQISASHWWSDTTFSLGFGIVFYALGWGATHGVCNGLNKIFHTNNY